MQIKKLVPFGSIVIFATFAIITSLAPKLAHGQAQAPAITANDLTSAGYSVMNQEMPQADGRYQGPSMYFRVHDVPVGSTGTDNLVMVSEATLTTQSNQSLYTYPNTTNHPFQIQGGTGVENMMPNGDARIAIDFIKNNNYIVVIGPVQQKVEALATSIAGNL